MGQLGSSDADKRIQTKGGIVIQLQKTGFVSNEQIQGILSIQLEESFRGHLLQLTLEGVEETHFTYVIHTGAGKNRHRRTVHARGLNKFLNFSLPIYDFCQNGVDNEFRINPGQWQIPFSLVIANALPSSMKFDQDKANNCKLGYCLVADIIPTDQNYKPISGRQEVFICQYIQPNLDAYTLSLVSKPKVCCCFESGSLNLSATVNKKTFSPDEDIFISLKCDLSAYSKTVTQLTASLVGNLILKGDNTKRTKMFKSFNQSYIVLVKGSLIQDKISIKIPSTIPLTSGGDLINLSYFISIEPSIDSCCCISENLPLIIPVTINPDQKSMMKMNFPQLFQVQAPQNWNPQKLQQSQFTQQQSLNYQQMQQNFRQQQEKISDYSQMQFQQPLMTQNQENEYL